MSNNIAYGISQPLQLLAPAPINATRIPNTKDVNYDAGQLWVDSLTFAPYILGGYNSSGVPQWLLLQSGGGAGTFSTLTVTPGPIALTATAAGGFTLNTGTQVLTLGAAADTGTITLGQSTAGQNINIGSGVNAGAQIISIADGNSAANSTVYILNGNPSAGTQTVNILSGTPTAGTQVLNLGVQNTNPIAVNIGNGTGVATVDIANSVEAHIVNIGAAGVTSTILGTAGINNSGAGVTTIGTGGTGAVNIGNATGNTSVTGTLGVAGTLSSSVAITATTGNITASNGNVILTAATTYISLPGPVRIQSGAGAPAAGLAVEVGDMYINTTAASPTTRIYVATAAGTWTNVTCAA